MGIVSIHAPVKVRLVELVLFHTLFAVSIHAPVKVRLNDYAEPIRFYFVSIHAPVKVRLDPFWILAQLIRFNPRTCKGATEASEKIVAKVKVSIHAPVKVRLKPDGQFIAREVFQSTHL